jgi:ferritin-like metal-binding protein YciE
LAQTTAGDELIRNSFANYAEVLGHASAKTLLNQSLREEESMAQWIADHLASTTLRFVERTGARVTAGV